MNKSSLDHIIKEALSQLDRNPPSWTPPPFDSLSGDSDLDHLVHSSLSSWTPEEPESDWEEFLDLHAEEIESDHPVDKIVSSKLSDSGPGFVPTPWNEFRQSLDLHSRRTRAVFIGKSIELLLFVLLLWAGFTPGLFTKAPITENNLKLENTLRGNEPDASSTETVVSSKADEELPSAESHASKTQSPAFESVTTATQSKAKPHFGEASTSATSLPTSKAESEMSSETGDILQSKTTETTENAKRNAAQSLSRSLVASKPSKNGANPKNEISNPLEPAPGNMLTQATFPNLPTLPLRKVSGMQLSSFELSLSDDFEKDLSSPLLPPDSKQQSVGLIWGWQLNRIRTAEDPIYPVPQSTQIDQNLFVGLEWEERSGDNAFGLTAGYQQWNYLAPQYAEIYRAQGVSNLHFIRLEDLKFEMINFGAFARKYIFSSERWEAFIHFGGGFRLALRSDYRVSSGDISAIDINRDDLTPEQIARLPDNPKLWNKNFQEGLLEGGSVNENSFMTIDVGGGVIHHLSDRWILQFSPIFNLSPFSDGLGPNRDEIHSLSLQMQIRRVLQ